jgi:hypothetical protein
MAPEQNIYSVPRKLDLASLFLFTTAYGFQFGADMGKKPTLMKPEIRKAVHALIDVLRDHGIYPRSVPRYHDAQVNRALKNH